MCKTDLIDLWVPLFPILLRKSKAGSPVACPNVFYEDKFWKSKTHEKQKITTMISHKNHRQTSHIDNSRTPSFLDVFIWYQSSLTTQCLSINYSWLDRRNCENGDGGSSNFTAVNNLCCAKYCRGYSHSSCIAYDSKSYTTWSRKRSLHSRSFSTACFTNVRKSRSEDLHGEPRRI